jgi:dipeptide transport system substrate-binding protein
MRILGFMALFVCLLSTDLLAKRKQKVTVCMDSPILTLDPHQAPDMSSIDAVHLKIYEPLVKRSGRKKVIFPLIAKKWIRNREATQWKFILREKIPFHSNKYFKPKRFLNAEDVKFSFDRQLRPEEFGVKNSVLISLGMNKLIKEIKVMGENTILFELHKSEPEFLEILLDNVGAIMSKEYYDFTIKKKRPYLFSKRPIGTGPFKYASYEKKAFLKLKTFDEYHFGKVQYDELHFLNFVNNQKRMDMLKFGLCDIVQNPNPYQLREFEHDKRFRVIHYEYNNMLYMVFNTKKKPFNNPKVRKAISHALNTSKYISDIFAGHAKKADHLVTPNVQGYSSGFANIEYDPAKARELLKEAGYEKGFASDFWTLPVPRIYCPDGRKLAKLIRDDLAKVGIRIRIVVRPWKKFLTETEEGKYNFAIIGWGNATARETLNDLTCASTQRMTNRSFWCNESFDKMSQLYFATENKSMKKEALVKASREFYTELPWYPMIHTSKLKVINQKIQGFHPLMDGAEDYSTISIFRAPSK